LRNLSNASNNDGLEHIFVKAIDGNEEEEEEEEKEEIVRSSCCPFYIAVQPIFSRSTWT